MEGFGDYAVRMNTIPEHVASRTLTEVSGIDTMDFDLIDVKRPDNASSASPTSRSLVGTHPRTSSGSPFKTSV